MRTLLFSLVMVIACFTMQAQPTQAQITKLNPIKNPSLDELRKNFAQPHRDYSTGPLWTWNDLLTEEQIRSTLQDLAKQNVKQVWVHPRPGLMTPYLSDDWFRMWKVSLDEAEKLDMNVWIYDENSYPSGFAGGFVPKALPDSRGMGLRFEEVERLDNIGENVWYVFGQTADGIYHPAAARHPSIEGNNSSPSEGWHFAQQKDGVVSFPKYLIARVQHTPQGGWFGGTWYVDLLKKGVTEKFIEVTHEAYKREVGEHFGKRVPGIFTDEPHPAGAYAGTWVSWNDEIPVLFEKKFGYSLIDNLPSLHKPVGDWKKVRHNYHALILELFVERWAKPNFEWCEANNLEWTGHYWEHGWPGTSHGPDNMAMYIWHQRPAIDLLMNGYNDTSPNAQFGNVRSVKELASIVNQMGRSRTLSENYGAGGWDIRFEDLKRLGDWSYALGVNTNNEHLSYVTIRGARKRDHPQSFSYHAPWFEGYHALADYFTRLSYVLSQGRQINRIVVIEPTTTAWMYQGAPELGRIGQSFTDFVNALEHAQVEYDLASEDVIARFGKIDGKTFSINQGEYDLVILPPNMENLNRRTAELMVQYLQNGGKMLCVGDFPSRCEGKELDASDTLVENALRMADRVEKVTTAEAVAAAKKRTAETGLSIEVPEGTRSIFHHKRTLPDCEILFICNADQEKTVDVNVNIFSSEKYVSTWKIKDGEVFQSFQCPTGGFTSVLSPSGNVLVILSDTAISGNVDRIVGKRDYTTIKGSDTTVKRLEPNVLTLDYVDVKVGNEERKDVYTYQADQWIWQKNGFGKNPFDNEVQFKDELITRTFPADSGFEAVYKFVIAGNHPAAVRHPSIEGNNNRPSVGGANNSPPSEGWHFAQQNDGVVSASPIPPNLAIVIERADLYTIYHNGIEVKPTPDAWWLDKSFGKIDLSKTAKVGENTVRIVSSPLTVWTALEPAYLLGDFSLRSVEKGFVVCPPVPLQLRTPEPEKKVVAHSAELERVSWLTKGIGFHGEDVQNGDKSPFVVFDFGKEYDLAEIQIWNYNESGLTKRGVKEMSIGPAYTSPIVPANVRPPQIVVALLKEGSSNGAQTISLAGKGFSSIQRVVFKIVSNYNGITYPVADNDLEKAKNLDNGFVGLAEVRFITKDGKVIEGVKIASKSSELVIATHDRRAAYLLDGSGLEPYQPQQGWNAQGMPFYAGKVEYSRSFDIATASGKYSVKLPESPRGWYGATARVVVNGNDAGYIVSAPWQVDVTPFVKQGKNEVSIQVYGTPKNLLGPHHAGRLRGSAWPGSFHQAPRQQPAGSAYDVIPYGLFEPFEVIKVVEQ